MEAPNASGTICWVPLSSPRPTLPRPRRRFRPRASLGGRILHCLRGDRSGRRFNSVANNIFEQSYLIYTPADSYLGNYVLTLCSIAVRVRRYINTNFTQLTLDLRSTNHVKYHDLATCFNVP